MKGLTGKDATKAQDYELADALRDIAAFLPRTDLNHQTIISDIQILANDIQDDGSKSSALRAIANAAVARPDEKIFTDLLDAVLQFARKEKVNRPMESIATYYAQQEKWGKALNALSQTGRTDKVIGLTRFVTALAESKNPKLIDTQ